jgi:hypothetical protein
MHKTLSAFLASGLIATGAAVAAQTPTTTAQSPTTTTTSSDKFDSKEITVSGCVEKTKSGGYFLMASAEPSASSTTTSPTGTSGTTTTAGTSTATTTAGAAPENAAHERGGAWNLGQSDKFEKYVGQRVQVTGRPEHDTSGDQLKGTKGPGEIKARDIDVKSVNVVASSCR